MKRAAAIILSLTVIWLQMLASAQTLLPTRAHAVAPECECCVEKEVCRCCCVAPVEPDARPLPAGPAVTSTSSDFNATISKRIVWSLPESASALVSSSDSSVSLLAVPLFTRHCALLI